MKTKNKSKHQLKPLSMYPLTPEEAIRGFMQVDPKKVEERLIKDGILKKKKSRTNNKNGHS